VEAGMVKAEQFPKWDLLEQFRRDTLRHLSNRSGATEAGIYQFADATDDQKLLAFVGKFGPIWGRVMEMQTDGLFKAQTIIVQQELAHLRWQRAKYTAAVRLLKQVNRSGRANPKEMTLAMMGIYPVPWGFMPKNGVPEAIAKLAVPTEPGMTRPSEDCPWLWSMLAVYELVRGKEEGKIERMRECGHRVLCQLFGEFPPILVPVQGRQPLEMPRIVPEGIAHVLYFRLRLDYLAGRAFGTCQNCGGQFPILKRGARACGETCRRALRNQRYWNRNKKVINRRRRVDRA
jgi:hypothetical protein